MKTYAFDSNTISYFLREEGNVRQNIEREVLQGVNPYAIPPMVIYEIMRWLRDNPTADMQIYTQKFDLLLQAVKHKSVMTLEMWEKSADIYIDLIQKKRLSAVKSKNKDADILIASFCLVNDYTLVTRNSKDFEHIDGLKIVDWF